jgi:hypothetical protein
LLLPGAAPFAAATAAVGDALPGAPQSCVRDGPALEGRDLARFLEVVTGTQAADAKSTV